MEKKCFFFLHIKLFVFTFTVIVIQNKFLMILTVYITVIISVLWEKVQMF